MAALALLGDLSQALACLARRAYISTIGTCLPSSRSPGSPTLSAQEGELDNLLTEPTGGWDEDDTISIAPRSIRYGKEGLLVTRNHLQPADGALKSSRDHAAHDQDARELGEVDAALVSGRSKETWEPGTSLEELEREEEELAKMDPPAPVIEFGEFEEARPASEEDSK